MSLINSATTISKSPIILTPSTSMPAHPPSLSTSNNSTDNQSPSTTLTQEDCTYDGILNLLGGREWVEICLSPQFIYWALEGFDGTEFLFIDIELSKPRRIWSKGKCRNKPGEIKRIRINSHLRVGRKGEKFYELNIRTSILNINNQGETWVVSPGVNFCTRNKLKVIETFQSSSGMTLFI